MKSLLVKSLPALAAHAATAASALVLTAAFALPATAAGAAAPAKADPIKGQEKAAACMACHTADGTRGLTSNSRIPRRAAERTLSQAVSNPNQPRRNSGARCRPSMPSTSSSS